MNKVPVLERNYLLELTAGDAEFAHELIDTYRASATAVLTRLAAALSAGEPTQIMREAHALKGASLNVGALAMAECAGTIEAAARAGDLALANRAAAQLDAKRAALWAELDRGLER